MSADPLALMVLNLVNVENVGAEVPAMPLPSLAMEPAIILQS